MCLCFNRWLVNVGVVEIGIDSCGSGVETSGWCDEEDFPRSVILSCWFERQVTNLQA